MNGYIQAEILGKNRGLKFGTLATEQIFLELAKLNADTNFYNSAMIAVIIYWGLYNNSFVKREEMDYTFESVVDWVDENTSEVETITNIVRTWEEAKSTQIMKDKVTEEVKKKNPDSTLVPKKGGKKSKPIA